MNKREMLVEFVAALAIAAISMLTVYSLAYAQHAVETGTGVVCDTSAQVTRLLKADDFQATLVAVNTEERTRAQSCPSLSSSTVNDDGGLLDCRSAKDQSGQITEPYKSAVRSCVGHAAPGR